MIPTKLRVATRSLVVAAAAASWLPTGAAGALQVQTTRPAAPQSLTATGTSSSSIYLVWAPPTPLPTGANAITGYRIDVSSNGITGWIPVIPDTNSDITTYTHGGLDPNTTLYYRVAAINAAGLGAYSNVDSGTTTGIAGTPSAPQNLTAVAGGPTIIDLDWDAPATDGGNPITYYEIYVSADAGVSWGPPQTTVQTEFRHASLTAGTTRHYRVRARNTVGSGAWTAVVSATTAAGTPPGPPRALTATATGSSAIELSWRAPLVSGSSAIIGYRIEWSGTRTGVWSVLVVNTGDTRTAYEDTGLAPNTTRYYRVSAINSFGTGAPSNIEGDITPLGVPDAPGRLTAEARGRSAIALDWTRPSSSGSSSVTGYRIEWSSTRTGRWRSLETNTRSTTTRYTDTGLSPGTTRYYRVAAISAAGTSPWSSVADATTDDLTVPGAPTGLRAAPSGVGGSTQLLLTWSAPANDGGSPITGYRIERAITRGGPWIIHLASTGSATTTYLHTGLSPNTTRFYRVRALNAQGHGDPSNVAEGTTNAARPGQPRNLRARATGPTSITLAWEVPTSDGGERITGYTIRMRGPNDGTWITIPRNTGPQETTFEHTGLRPATAYRYQVAAINRVGPGQWSFETSTSTYAQAPGAPTGLTARAVGTSRIDLSWGAPRNTGGAPILGYQIQASDDGGSTWRNVRRNTSSTGTTFSDVNLQPATTRHYRVAALNTAGTGPFSNTARATTEATVPGVPRSLDAEADGTSRIELSWRAPTSDGGSRITGYRIEVSEDGGTRWDDLVSQLAQHAHDLRAHGAGAGHQAPLPRLGDQPDRREPGVPGGERHYRRDRARRAHRADGHRGHVHADRPVLGSRPPTTAAPPSPATASRSRRMQRRGRILVVNTGSRATAFSHTDLLPGSSRHYRVSAINRVGVGAPSDTASAATDDPVGRAGRLNTPCPAARGGRDDIEHGLGDRPPRRRGGQRDGHGAAHQDQRALVVGREPVRAGRGRPRPRAGRPGRPRRPLRRHLLHDAPGRLRRAAAVRPRAHSWRAGARANTTTSANRARAPSTGRATWSAPTQASTRAWDPTSWRVSRARTPPVASTSPTRPAPAR